MLRRVCSLSAVLVLLLPALAHAHKLLAKHQYLSNGKVRIESRFETGDVPLDATAVVYRAKDVVLCEGSLDAQGLFAFKVMKAEDLVVEVSDGTGHRVEVNISAKQLAEKMGQDAAAQAGACLFAPPLPLASLSAVAVLVTPDHIVEPKPDLALTATGPPLGRVLLGVGLLLAVAGGFYLLQRSRKPGASARPDL
jgi:hypothetical protein